MFTRLSCLHWSVLEFFWGGFWHQSCSHFSSVQFLSPNHFLSLSWVSLLIATNCSIFCRRFLFSFPATHPTPLSVCPKGQTHPQKWKITHSLDYLPLLCTQTLLFKGRREVTGTLLSNIITYHSGSQTFWLMTSGNKVSVQLKSNFTFLRIHKKKNKKQYKRQNFLKKQNDKKKTWCSHLC